MHPNVNGFEARALCRLGTLAHEAIHAYLNQFACRQCPTYDVNYANAVGYERAFHYIAGAIEWIFVQNFGVQLYVAFSHDVTGRWDRVRRLPRLHDMAEWKWFAEMRPHY
jgi:hypothetical protein